MRNTIKAHKDFQTPRDFPFAVTDLFSVHTKLAKYPDDPRYGLVVTKKNFRFAVKRNRVKRLLRDWIAFADDYMCPDLDYVFFARPDILSDAVTREIGRAAMVSALKTIKRKNETRTK
jgi:ribonuclease P protein component